MKRTGLLFSAVALLLCSICCIAHVPGRYKVYSFSPSQLGVVGSWQSRHVILGLEEMGLGDRVWDYKDCTYGHGDIREWAKPNSPMWKKFSDQLAKHPNTDAIWFQVTVYAQTGSRASSAQYNDVVAVIRRIRSFTPVPIYISGLAGHQGYHCKLHGPKGTQVSRYLADKVRKKQGSKLVIRKGPGMGPLKPALIDKPACVSNSDGRQLLASQVATVFGWAENALDADDFYRVDLTPDSGKDLLQ